MNPEVPSSVRSGVSVGVGEDVRDGQDLWEQVFAPANLAVALGRVERNRGAAGVDGVSTQELRDWCRSNWVAVREALDAGTYRPVPVPVRQVMIPKPDGGQRKLGGADGAGSVDPAGDRASADSDL
ncbi:hypothetical protein [Mycobacterium syngnathidarum]